MKVSSFASVVLSAVLSPLVACSPADEAALTSESAATAAPALAPIKGRQWVRCALAPADDSALTCSSTDPGKDPLHATVKVEAASLAGGADHSKPIDIERASTITIGSFPRSAFPIRITLSAVVDNRSFGDLGIAGSREIRNEIQVDAPEALGERAVLSQPFDLWPVGLIYTGSRAYTLEVESYPVSIALYHGSNGDSDTTFTVAPQATSLGWGSQVIYFLKPTDGRPLRAKLSESEGAERIALRGPGYWAIDNGVLRRATAEESSYAFGARETRPPVPHPPTFCGSDLQTPCLADDGSEYCVANNRLILRWDYGNFCQACGDDGQTYCTDWFGDATCSPGLHVVSEEGEDVCRQ